MVSISAWIRVPLFDIQPRNCISFSVFPQPQHLEGHEQDEESSLVAKLVIVGLSGTEDAQVVKSDKSHGGICGVSS